ncbi:DNA-directed RNA polymerase I subunit RPA43 [Ooceraea biroi]|uniref:DNA-directed RNA polymerase I subunit RPA43 n=1 Tax=Ooceraea biroi TaxID=2015173 RepID=A0A026W1Z1_OOCBI|nr:DNA-directed RNA polymerase I subunit RPA43 [Ooceraea biroi]
MPNPDQKWTTLELTGLVEDEDSHVCFQRTTKHLALHPYHFNDVQKALNSILDSFRNTYDRDLEGFVLDFKKPKLLSNLGHTFYDSPFIHVDVEADFYLFRPTVGCILKGIVNKTGADHVIMLVHKMFTVSIPKQYNMEEWPGDKVEVGQQIRCHLTEINKWSKLPFICGTLKSDYLEGCRLSESMIYPDNVIAADLDTASVSRVNENGENTINNFPCESSDEERKLSPKKRARISNNSAKLKIKKEKGTTSVVKTSPIKEIEKTLKKNIKSSGNEKKNISTKHTKSRDSYLKSAWIKKEEDVSDVNNSPGKERRRKPKDHERMSTDFNRLGIKIKKEEGVSDVNDSPGKERRRKPKDHERTSTDFNTLGIKIKKEETPS